MNVLDVHDCSEAIVFEFKKIIGMVERFFHQAESHRVNTWEHVLFYHLKFVRT